MPEGVGKGQPPQLPPRPSRIPMGRRWAVRFTGDGLKAMWAMQSDKVVNVTRNRDKGMSFAIETKNPEELAKVRDAEVALKQEQTDLAAKVHFEASHSIELLMLEGLKEKIVADVESLGHGYQVTKDNIGQIRKILSDLKTYTEKLSDLEGKMSQYGLKKTWTVGGLFKSWFGNKGPDLDVVRGDFRSTLALSLWSNLKSAEANIDVVDHSQVQDLVTLAKEMGYEGVPMSGGLQEVVESCDGLINPIGDVGQYLDDNFPRAGE
jgi:hypothetical protein